MMKIKALVVWDPWATLFRLQFQGKPLKTLETRSWATDYRGPLLICAAKRAVNLHILKEINYWLAEMGKPQLHRSDFYPGHAIAIGNLVDCISTIKLGEIIEAAETGWGEAEWAKEELHFGNYDPDRYAWKLESLKAIEPFPVSGRQGLFEVELPDNFEWHEVPHV